MNWSLNNTFIIRKIIDWRYKVFDKDYKTYVGPSDSYDLLGAIQFNLLTFLGLREYHSFLDIGCGSLRAGKFFISYLRPRNYYGIEPNNWLIKEAIKNEIGEDLIKIKKPIFSKNNKFNLSLFNRKFDFILAHGIFNHATQKQIKRCVSEAKKVMKPNSIFAANFSKGKKNYEGNQWLYYTKNNTTSYTKDYIINIAKQNGLVCKLINWPRPSELTWVVFTHPENKNIISNLNHILEYYAKNIKIKVK